MLLDYLCLLNSNDVVNLCFQEHSQHLMKHLQKWQKTLTSSLHSCTCLIRTSNSEMTDLTSSLQRHIQFRNSVCALSILLSGLLEEFSRSRRSICSYSRSSFIVSTL